MDEKNSFLKFLSEEDLEKIDLATLDILENKGVLFTRKEALSIFKREGLPIEEEGVVKFPPELVKEAISCVPKNFVRRGFKSEYDVKMGEGKCYFGGGSLPLYVVDSDTYQRREALKKDMVNFTRLVDRLPNFSFGNGVVKPSDVPDSVIHAIWIQNIIENTSKPSCCWYATSVQMAQDTIEILSAASGGLDELKKRKTWAITACPVSGLKWGDSVIGLIEMAKVGIPVEIMDTPFPGSMSPVTLAGTLVLSNATILSGVVLSQIINPGTPVVYALYGGIMDMRTGTHAFATPETALYSAAAVQLCQQYGIPTNMTAPTSDSKVPDAQAAYEKMMVALVPALAGADSLTLLGGVLDFGLSASYEQMVIDNEIAGQILRILKNFEVNEETLAVGTIKERDYGGYYLDSEHTLKYFKDTLWVPFLSDRQIREVWEAKGSKDILKRAKEKVKEILSGSFKSSLSEKTLVEVRKVVKKICQREKVSIEEIL